MRRISRNISRALRKRVHDGTIPYTKKGKLLYFSKQDVNKYLLDK